MSIRILTSSRYYIMTDSFTQMEEHAEQRLDLNLAHIYAEGECQHVTKESNGDVELGLLIISEILAAEERLVIHVPVTSYRESSTNG